MVAFEIETHEYKGNGKGYVARVLVVRGPGFEENVRGGEVKLLDDATELSFSNGLQVRRNIRCVWGDGQVDRWGD